MRIFTLGVLMLSLGACSSLGPAEREQWDAAIYALGNAMVQFGNQQMEADRLRQLQVQQPMRRQAVCYNHGSFLSCTTY